MKRFIIRSAVFMGTLVLVFGSICVWELRYELRAYRNEIKAPSTAHTLVCNDSQAEMSVNPKVDATFFNFSAPGRTMDQAYLAMLDLFKANPRQFKTVVVDISPSAAADTFDQPIPKMGYASQYYLLHWLHRRENTRDMTGEFVVFRDNMVGRRWRLFWRSLRGRAHFTSSICGAYKPVMEALAVSRPKDFRGQFKARAITVNKAPVVTEDAPIFTHVGRIVRLARAQGAEPVLLTTPWHTNLLQVCDAAHIARFERTMETMAQKWNCRYLNMLRHPLPDDGWYDAQHLNVRGAKLFTPALRAALEKK